MDNSTIIIGIGIVCLIIGAIGGYLLSDGVPIVINLEESQRDSLLRANERSIESCENKYDREINKLTNENMNRVRELAETNQSLVTYLSIQDHY